MRFPIVLCALLILLGCQSEEERRAAYTRSATEYFEAEQWKEAKIEYLNLLQLDPDSAEANYRLGEVQQRLGEYGDALWRYREAVRLEPDRAPWRARLAALLVAARRSDEAREQVDAALESDPESAQALLIAARLDAAAEDHDQALQRLDQILVLTSEFKPEGEELSKEEELVRGLRQAAYMLKAQVQLYRQEFDAAEVTMRAFAKDFDDPGPHLLLAVFLVDRERSDEAQVEYRAAVAAADTEDDRLRSQFAMAGFLASRDDIEGAERALVEAREASPDRDEPLLQLATLYARAGRNEEAAGILEEVAEKQSDQARPLLVLSNFYRLQGETDKAIEALERALAREPDNEQAILARAEFLMDQRAERPELTDEARAVVDAVLEENPDSVLGLFTKAKFELIDDENEAAANHLRRVVQERPSSLAHVMLAMAYQRLGQPDLARSELLAAIRLDESNLPARRALAQLYFESGNYLLAIQESEASLRRAPGDVAVVLLRARALAANRQRAEARAVLDAIEYPDEGANPLRVAAVVLYLQLGAGDEAMALAEAVLADEPTNSAAIQLWVTQKARAGETEVALARIEQALEASPDDASLYELRAAVALASAVPADQPEELHTRVMRDLDTAIGKAPGRGAPWVLKADVYRLEERWEEADQSLLKAIERAPSQVNAYAIRAELLERREENARAMAAYEALLSVHPDYAMARNNLAWLLANSASVTPEELDRAQELAQEAKEAFPDNASISDTLGWVMLKKQIPRAAIPLFREAIGTAPNSFIRATARYHLALAYEQAGEPGKAIAELEISIEEDESFPDRGDAKQTLERLRAG